MKFKTSSIIIHRCYLIFHADSLKNLGKIKHLPHLWFVVYILLLVNYYFVAMKEFFLSVKS